MATVRELAIKVTGDSYSYARAMGQAKNTGTQFYQAMEGRAKRFDAYIAQNNRSIEAINYKLTTLGKSAASVAATFAGGFAISNVLSFADDYGQMAARIRIALKSAEGDIENYAQVQERLLEVSNRNGRELDQSQELYIASASSMKELGYNAEQTLDFIESLSNELTINATSAQKTESAINAISKAMSIGKLDSNAFQSVLSAMPTVVDELATYLGKTGNEVKALGLSGKISITEFSNALILAKDKTTELANSMENTYNDALTHLKNNLKALVGEANQTYQITQTLSGGIKTVAENLDTVVSVSSVIIGLGLARYFGNLSSSIYNSTVATINKIKSDRTELIVERQKIQSQLQLLSTQRATLEVQRQNILMAQAHTTSMRAQNSLAAQLTVVESKLIAVRNAETAATARLTAANKSLSLVQKAGSTLLGVMGGPVGLIATVGVLAATFIDFSGSADKAKESIADMSLPVDELIKKYEALNTLQKQVFLSEQTRNISEATEKITEQADAVKDLAERYLSTTETFGFGYGATTMTDIWNEDHKTAFNEFSNQLDFLSEKVKNGEITNELYATSVSSLTDNLIKNTGMATRNKDSLIESAAEITKTIETLNKAKSILGGINVLDNFVGPVLPKNYSLPEGKSSTDDKDLEKIGKLYESQLDSLNRQIESYQNLTAYQRVSLLLETEKFKKLEPEKKAVLQAKAAEIDRLEAVKKQETELEKARKEAARELEQRQKSYNDLVLSLRTPLQKATDQMHEQVDLIDRMAKTEEERLQLRAKLAEQSLNQAPNFNYISSYSGIGGDLINVAEHEKNLKNWHKEQLQLQQSFLKQKQINEEDYNKNLVKIQSQYQKQQEDLQGAYQMATLGVFSSMTGDIADMFKETAGESSAAYKIMFLASKAASIGQAIISTEVAANKALELGPIMGIPAASMVRGLGYASVGLIAAQTISGMAHDGIDSIPREGTWLLDKGERVVDARTNADLKDFIKSNKSGGNLTINVPINLSDGQLSESDGKQLGKNLKQLIHNYLIDQHRPGGVLNRR